MRMSIFALLGVLLGAYLNSCYHPQLLFKKFIVIKNTVLMKVLINPNDPVDNRCKNAKANRNKLTYAGLVGYGVFLLFIPFTVVMHTLSADELTSIFAGAIFMGEMAFGFLNSSRYAVKRATAKKTVAAIYTVVTIVSAAASVCCMYYGICGLIKLL